MNYYAKFNLEGKEYPLLVSSAIDDKFYSVKEILSAERLSTNVYLSSDEGIDYPFLVVEEGEGNNISALVQLFKSNGFTPTEDMFDRISERLKRQVSAEGIGRLYSCYMDLMSYIEGDRVQIKMQPSWFTNYTRTKQLVDEINSSGKASEMFIDGENKTKYMNSPTDELFIIVPSYEELAMEGGPVIPQPDTFISPYESSELNTVNYKAHLKDTPLEFVLGSPTNNTLEIQSNEQRYYNSLVSLMNYGIAQEFPDKTLEQCQEDNIGSIVVLDYLKSLAVVATGINWNHTGLIPVTTLNALVEDEDGEINDAKGSEMESNRAYGKENLSIENFTDGEYIIVEMLEKAFARDIYEPIRIVIKLLRWGNRKPTRVFIPHLNNYLDLNTFMFVRSSGNFVPTEIECDSEGNNLFPICSIIASDVVYDRRYLSANKLNCANVNIPIGMACERRYKNSSDRQVVFISFIDIIKSYQSKEELCKIKGVSLVNGEIILTPETEILLTQESLRLSQCCENVNASNSSSHVYYVYDKFRDAFMTMNAFDRRLSILSMLNKSISKTDLSVFGRYSYTTMMELEAVVKTYIVPPVDVIEGNMLNYLLPVVLEINQICESALLKTGGDLELQEILKLYTKVCNKNGFTGDFGSEEPLPVVSTTTKTSNAFSQTEKPKDTAKDTSKENTEVPASNVSQTTSISLAEVFMDRSEVTTPAARIVVDKPLYDKLLEVNTQISNLGTERSATGEKVIVGYIIPKGKEFQLLDPHIDVDKAKTIVNLNVLPRVLVSNVQALATGSNIRFKFQNENAAKYYCGIIDKLLSKGVLL